MSRNSHTTPNHPTFQADGGVQETNRMAAAGSSTDTVLRAVQELSNLGQIATRETVQELTGLKQTIVDDRLRELADMRQLRRVTRGVYELVVRHPAPRAMSYTELDDGCVKLEIGDELLTLTPEETRKLARGLGGFLSEAHMIDTARAHLRMATDVAAEMIELRKRVDQIGAALGQHKN